MVAFRERRCIILSMPDTLMLWPLLCSSICIRLCPPDGLHQRLCRNARLQIYWHTCVHQPVISSRGTSWFSAILAPDLLFGCPTDCIACRLHPPCRSILADMVTSSAIEIEAALFPGNALGATYIIPGGACNWPGFKLFNIFLCFYPVCTYLLS